jgi:hypothetical protein
MRSIDRSDTIDDRMRMSESDTIDHVAQIAQDIGAASLYTIMYIRLLGIGQINNEYYTCVYNIRPLYGRF